MDAVVAQIQRVLQRVVKLQDPRLSFYLDAVSKKYISRFTFYGIPPGMQCSKENRKAKEYLIVEIDWQKHDGLVTSDPVIRKNNDWEGNVNPDIILESQEFLDKCSNSALEIIWDFSRTQLGKTNEAWFHERDLIDKGVIISLPSFQKVMCWVMLLWV
jgi:hypothetical protein